MLNENTCAHFLKTWFWHSCRREGRHLTFWVSKGIFRILFWLGFCLPLDRPVTSWIVTLALYIVCLQHGGMWSTVYSPSNYGQWSIQVPRELPAPEKPVSLFVCLFYFRKLLVRIWANMHYLNGIARGKNHPRKQTGYLLCAKYPAYEWKWG